MLHWAPLAEARRGRRVCPERPPREGRLEHGRAITGQRCSEVARRGLIPDRVCTAATLATAPGGDARTRRGPDSRGRGWGAAQRTRRRSAGEEPEAARRPAHSRSQDGAGPGGTPPPAADLQSEGRGLQTPRPARPARRREEEERRRRARTRARARDRPAVDAERGRARAPSGRRAGRQAAAAAESRPAPRHAVRGPRLSRGHRRRAGSGARGGGLGAGPGPCARCPDDAARRARPPGARPGPGPVAWGAGGGHRARLRAVRAPLPLRPGARLRLPRQLLWPRTADAWTRAAHPHRRHRAVSTSPPRAEGRAVAMAPGGRRDSGAPRAWGGLGAPAPSAPGRGPAGQAAGLAGLAGRGRVPGL